MEATKNSSILLYLSKTPICEGSEVMLGANISITLQLTRGTHTTTNMELHQRTAEPLEEQPFRNNIPEFLTSEELHNL